MNNNSYKHLVDQDRYHTERDYIGLFFLGDESVDPVY